MLPRRKFLQIAAASTGLAITGTDLLSRAVANASTTIHPNGSRGISHIVILMMENRSFDHYLGWLPGADGRQAGLQFTDKRGVKHATHRLTGTFQGCGFMDPDHSWDGGRTQLDGGKLDGSLKADSDVFSIGYYGESDL